jgi:LysR family transcriptional regulator, glycine cleavage system transcriptional activator
VAGVRSSSRQRHRRFDHFFVTRQAVVDGLGSGIGPLPILQIDIESGTLLTPFPAVSERRKGYVALVPFDANKTPSLDAFVEWLIREGTPVGDKD